MKIFQKREPMLVIKMADLKKFYLLIFILQYFICCGNSVIDHLPEKEPF